MKTIHSILLATLFALVSAAYEQAAAAPISLAASRTTSLAVRTAAPVGDDLACIAACYATYQAGLASCDATCPYICTMHVVLVGCVQWERDDACHDLCAEGHAAQLRSCLEDCDADPPSGN